MPFHKFQLERYDYALSVLVWWAHPFQVIVIANLIFSIMSLLFLCSFSSFPLFWLWSYKVNKVCYRFEFSLGRHWGLKAVLSMKRRYWLDIDATQHVLASFCTFPQSVDFYLKMIEAFFQAIFRQPVFAPFSVSQLLYCSDYTPCYS